ncbi:MULTISPECIES: cytochrome b6f subunit PetP [Aphanothece]|uniref:cytochrome b6f subunit PetP n=1 Tax=Aphanothece TaxID=1121 RepID=UPI0039855A5E
MAQAATITIGSKVRVLRVRDRIPADLVEALKADPTGTVTGFRTVDGQGIGLEVDLGAGKGAWFFDDEVTLA